MKKIIELEEEIRLKFDESVVNNQLSINAFYELSSDIIFETIHTEIEKYFSSHYKLVQGKDNTRFYYNKILYEIGYYVDKIDKSKFSITILGLNIENIGKSIYHESRLLSTLSEFSTIEVLIDQNLKRHTENILFISETLMSFGFQWIYEGIKSQLNNSLSVTNARLYEILRQNIPPKLHKDILLYIVYEKGGIYLMDSCSLDFTMEKIKSSNYYQIPPLETILELTTKTLPHEGLASIEAVKSKKPIVLNFQRAKYYESGLQIAEEISFQCGSILVHPLVTEGNTLLVVGYPPNLKPLLEERIEVLKPQFVSAISEGKSSLLKSLNNLSKIDSYIPSNVWGNLGRFTYRFLEEMMKSQ